MSFFFGNGSQSVPAAWHPEPNIRGTWTILSTCLLTMFLCIWTVIHLNIPDEKHKHAQIWRRCGALIIGLLAPELIAWNAWEQRRRVKELTERMKMLRWRARADRAASFNYSSEPSAGCRPRLKSAWRRIKVALLLEPAELEEVDPRSCSPGVTEDYMSTWTDHHSWYALMGGFAFDTTSAETPFLPNGRKVLMLTTPGVCFMAKYFPHLLPVFSRDDIKAKGKSDSLTKVITCWQAIWFCVQCITRLAEGLSICLLELNVFGHAICALAIYAIWWDKPKDVDEPTKITSSESNSVAALLYTMSQKDHETGLGKFMIWIPSAPEEGYDCRRPLNPTEIYNVRDLASPNCIELNGSFWSLADCLPPRLGLTSWKRSHEYYKISVDGLLAARLSQIQHLDLMREMAKVEFPVELGLLGSEEGYVHEDTFRNRLVDLDTFGDELGRIDRAPFGSTRFPWVLFSMTVATCLYGGLHAVAWDASFPTPTERLLWRASALTVALFVLGIVVLVCITYPLEAISDMVKMAEGTRLLTQLWHWVLPPPSEHWSCRRRAMKRDLESFTDKFAATVAVSLLIWYVICRAFLVVESFINLAHLPEATLKMPNWSQYVPHIT